MWNTWEVFICVCWWRKIQTLFVLLFCFSSPCQRPLSAAHTVWPQPVPTVYCDCHQAHGGPNKGGSVPIVLPRIVSPSLGTNWAKYWGLLEEHRGFDFTDLTARLREEENKRKTMRRREKERKMKSYNRNQGLFKSPIGNCCNVNTCGH